jgi:hypothetical protein
VSRRINQLARASRLRIVSQRGPEPHGAEDQAIAEALAHTSDVDRDDWGLVTFKSADPFNDRPASVMHPTAHVGGEDGRRWRSHLENQRSRAQRMRETRWTRDNETVLAQVLRYLDAVNPKATPSEIADRITWPKAASRNGRSREQRVRRLLKANSLQQP